MMKNDAETASRAGATDLIHAKMPTILPTVSAPVHKVEKSK